MLVPPVSLKLDLDAAISGDGSRLARQAGDLKVVRLPVDGGSTGPGLIAACRKQLVDGRGRRLAR